MPMPNTTTAKQRTLPTPTAPMAAGPSRPTIAMSTMPIAIQPSSAPTIGAARRIVGGSSRRSARRGDGLAEGRGDKGIYRQIIRRSIHATRVRSL